MKRAAPNSPASPGACSPEAGAMALRVLITGSTGYVPWHSRTMQDLRVKVHTWSREGTQIPRQRNDLQEVIQSCTLYAQHCTAHIHHIHILRIRRCSRSCTSVYHMMHACTMHVMRVGMFGRTSPTGPPKVCAQLRSVQQKLKTDGFAKNLQRRVQKEGFWVFALARSGASCCRVWRKMAFWLQEF